MSGISALKRPSAILFACTMNAVRSPMAEALMRHFHGRNTWVRSVGVHKGEQDAFAIQVMEEIGLDISHHRPTTFEALEDTYFDVIISLSPEAHHNALELTRTMACPVEYWPTLDPAVVEGSREIRLDAYRAVRDKLQSRVLKRFPLTVAHD
jgi:protein-tyrosine-phosphatase